MYEPLRRLAAALLKVPLEPPEPPAGSRESTTVFRASPRYLTYKLIPFWFGVAVELVAILPVVIVSISQGNRLLLVLEAIGCVLLAMGTFLGYCAIRLDYELRYYILTDRSLRLREGAWLMREMTLTHANVQDVSISQGPLQRLLGIADVVVKTAGGGAAAAHPGGQAHMAMLAGVDAPQYVRDRIRAYLREQQDDGLGDVAAPTTAPASAAPALTGPAVVAALRDMAEAARLLRVAAERRPSASAGG
jgi:membrane protein YdbS with pleckstrin-like domain